MMYTIALPDHVDSDISMWGGGQRQTVVYIMEPRVSVTVYSLTNTQTLDFV